jgi:hypothetical protein
MNVTLVVAVGEGSRIEDVVEGGADLARAQLTRRWFSNNESCRACRFKGETFTSLTA